MAWTFLYDSELDSATAIPPRSVLIMRGHEDRVWAVAFSADGKCLATGGVDTSVRLWDLSGPLESGADDGACCGGEASPCALGDPWPALSPAAAATCVGVLDGKAGRVRCLSFSCNRRHLASGSDEGAVKVCTLHCLCQFQQLWLNFNLAIQCEWFAMLNTGLHYNHPSSR